MGQVQWMGMGGSFTPQMGGSSTTRLYVPAFCVGWPIVKSINFLFTSVFYLCFAQKRHTPKSYFPFASCCFRFCGRCSIFSTIFFVGINVGDFGIYAA